MKYTIEFELPDNDTVLNNIKTVQWGVWGYSGYSKAQPVKKGKWLPDNNSYYETRFVCSECKESQVVPTIGFRSYKPLWDWCPLCGAKMEEGEQDGKNT